MILGSLDVVKSLYEALGELQSKISDLEDFENRNEFREDYRGWRYDTDCGCNRCKKFSEEFLRC